jgi:hypothetical protein
MFSACSEGGGIESPTSPTPPPVVTSPPPVSGPTRTLVYNGHMFRLDAGTPENPSIGVGARINSKYVSGSFVVQIQIDESGEYPLRVTLRKYASALVTSYSTEVSDSAHVVNVRREIEVVLPLPEQPAEFGYGIRIQSMTEVLLNGYFSVYHTSI